MAARRRLLGRAVALGAAVLGVAVFAYVLFGPTVTRCSFGEIGSTGIGQPVVTLKPAFCETVRLVDSQPVWPMPLLALTFWSLVPLLAVVAAWRALPWLALTAVLLELTALISFGVGPYYVLFVGVPLVVTWILVSSSTRRSRA